MLKEKMWKKIENFFFVSFLNCLEGFRRIFRRKQNELEGLEEIGRSSNILEDKKVKKERRKSEKNTKEISL